MAEKHTSEWNYSAATALESQQHQLLHKTFLNWNKEGNVFLTTDAFPLLIDIRSLLTGHTLTFLG